MIKRLFLLSIAMPLLISSCKKGKTASCDMNAASFAGVYKITALVYKADANATEVDVWAFNDACKRDDTFTFNTNNTYAFTDIGITCTPPQGTTGAWTLSGSTLTLGNPNNPEIYTILNFDCNGWKATSPGADAGELYTVTYIRL